MKTLISCCCLLLSVTAFSQQAEVLYKTYCAGCHGARLEGGAGPLLIKEKWVHGSSFTALYKTIKTGVPNTEMKGWGNVLSAKQINTLVNYIRSSQKGPIKTATSIPLRIVSKDYILRIEKIELWPYPHTLGHRICKCNPGPCF